MATKKPAQPKPGRTTTFSAVIAAEICLRLAKGEPLAQICRDDHMPASRTVSDWKAAHDAFAADFAHAREEGFDYIAADCMAIADETAFDTIIGESGDRANTEWISRSKLRVETRLKLLAKWDPKRYGDRLTVGGADDMPAIKTETNVTMDAAEAYKLMLGIK